MELTEWLIINRCKLSLVDSHNICKFSLVDSSASFEYGGHRNMTILIVTTSLAVVTAFSPSYMSYLLTDN
jgi:hypothetical protein